MTFTLGNTTYEYNPKTGKYHEFDPKKRTFGLEAPNSLQAILKANDPVDHSVQVKAPQPATPPSRPPRPQRPQRPRRPQRQQQQQFVPSTPQVGKQYTQPSDHLTPLHDPLVPKTTFKGKMVGFDVKNQGGGRWRQISTKTGKFGINLGIEDNNLLCRAEFQGWSPPPSKRQEIAARKANSAALHQPVVQTRPTSQTQPVAAVDHPRPLPVTKNVPRPETDQKVDELANTLNVRSLFGQPGHQKAANNNNAAAGGAGSGPPKGPRKAKKLSGGPGGTGTSGAISQTNNLLTSLLGQAFTTNVLLMGILKIAQVQGTGQSIRNSLRAARKLQKPGKTKKTTNKHKTIPGSTKSGIGGIFDIIGSLVEGAAGLAGIAGLGEWWWSGLKPDTKEKIKSGFEKLTNLFAEQLTKVLKEATKAIEDYVFDYEGKTKLFHTDKRYDPDILTKPMKMDEPLDHFNERSTTDAFFRKQAENSPLNAGSSLDFRNHKFGDIAEKSGNWMGRLNWNGAAGKLPEYTGQVLGGFQDIGASAIGGAERGADWVTRHILPEDTTRDIAGQVTPYKPLKLNKPIETAIPPASKLTPNVTVGSDGKVNPQDLLNFFKNRGVPEKAAQAIVKNISAESSYIPTVENKGHVGLAQWGGTRRKALEQFAKDENLPATDPLLQAKFLLKEIKNTDGTNGLEAKAYQKLLNNTNSGMNLDDLVKSWAEDYERPFSDMSESQKTAEIQRRQAQSLEPRKNQMGNTIETAQKAADTSNQNAPGGPGASPTVINTTNNYGSGSQGGSGEIAAVRDDDSVVKRTQSRIFTGGV